jgi:hypothetical protein
MARRGEAECFDITPEAETNKTKPPIPHDVVENCTKRSIVPRGLTLFDHAKHAYAFSPLLDLYRFLWCMGVRLQRSR